MDTATQCMTAVIGSIKQNPELSEEEAEAVVGSFYPDQGEMRLQLYTQAMYDVASILENTYEALRAKIVELSVEDLGRIMPSVRVVADELLKPYLEQLALEVRKAELEEILAGPSPVKAEPDVEAMEFWNMMGDGVMEWNDMTMELEHIEDQLGSI